MTLINNHCGILTMTRGDSDKIKDWLIYHSMIGFRDFYIILDNPNDDTEDRINALAFPGKIYQIKKRAYGPYYDGLSEALVKEARDKWRIEKKREIEQSGLPINDEISWRQYSYFSGMIRAIKWIGRTNWICLLDVDEYIELSKWETIGDMVASVNSERIRLLSFNYDTSEYLCEFGNKVYASSVYRWSYDDMMLHDGRWDKRSKSIVQIDKALPLASVHEISKGEFRTVDFRDAKINHYKSPPMKIMRYSVYDPLQFGSM